MIGSRLALLRLFAPVLLVVAVVMNPEFFIRQIERVSGLHFVIDVILLWSTLPIRIVAGIVLVAGFFLLLALSRRYVPPPWQAAVVFAAVAAPFMALALSSKHAQFWWIGPLVGFVLAVNSMPASIWAQVFSHPLGGRVSAVGFSTAVGAAEVLATRPYTLWLRHIANRPYERSGSTLAHALPGVLVGAVILALVLPYPRLVAAQQEVLRSPGVERIWGSVWWLYSRYDATSIHFDRQARRLYLCGNGLSKVVAIDIDLPGKPSRELDIPTGSGQFCSWDPVRRHILLVDRRRQMLVVGDPDTGTILREVPMEGLPKGEVFVEVNQPSGRLILGSESIHGIPTDVPATRILDADSLEVLENVFLAPGYLTTHPDRPVAYASYFHNATGLDAVDLDTGEIVSQAPTDERSDRILVDTKRNEVLVTSPVRSRILVFDAETLAPKAPIQTVFGVRSLQIDTSRDLLLAVSILNNRMDIIDLETRKSIGTMHVGPWMRDIVLDEAAGVAWVSFRHGVYELRYASPL